MDVSSRAANAIARRSTALARRNNEADLPSVDPCFRLAAALNELLLKSMCDETVAQRAMEFVEGALADYASVPIPQVLRDEVNDNNQPRLLTSQLPVSGLANHKRKRKRPDESSSLPTVKKCGICQFAGHYRTTCPNKLKTQASDEDSSEAE